MHDVKGYIYLNVEHQSTPQELMAFRLLRYKIAIMKQHLDQGHKKLPSVISILFYQGREQPYPYSLELIDSFEDKEFAKQYFFAEPFLVDLSQIPDESLCEDKTAGPLAIVQKHIFNRDLANIAQALVKLIQSNHIQLEHELFNSLVYYMLSQGDTSDVQQVIDTLLTIDSHREDVMNAAQQLEQQGLKKGLQQGLEQGLQQGMQQGMQQGRHEEALTIARNLLADGMSPQAVQRFTGLPEAEVVGLVKQH